MRLQSSGTYELSQLTNNHDVEVETLPDTLAVPLVGQIGKANIASELPADNVPVVVDNGNHRA
jgi:hypothetical protein